MPNPYEGYKVLGPYLNTNTGRQNVHLCKDGIKEDTLYSRYLVEISLGRKLNKNEIVDHIDGNYTNDTITNLRILTNANHVKSHCKTLKTQIFICPHCKRPFSLSGNKLHAACKYRLKNMSGPFCSQHCSNTASSLIRYRNKQYAVATITKEYYIPHEQEKVNAQ